MAEPEFHPFTPFLPPNAKLLMCGTFPPKRSRWSMDLYYPNFINDMWRIFGIIFKRDKEIFVDAENKTFKKNEIIALLVEKGIALSDTGREVVRTKDNASDKYLRIDKPIDLCSTLSKMPECMNVATTGEKAAAVIAEITRSSIPAVGEYTDCVLKFPDGSIRNLRHWRMPSSSRAYPMKIDKKAEYYEKMFLSLGMV